MKKLFDFKDKHPKDPVLLLKRSKDLLKPFQVTTIDVFVNFCKLFNEKVNMGKQKFLDKNLKIIKNLANYMGKNYRALGIN
ncbi:hypothetical protein BpHYR1_047486 [Brachionus plicatilis]|uniref:Uncharacterized protein n=1 Tax=Brachionus plicatilis TaxID=10195 RepID=A0A3M7QFU9_BRAPC|nr:hypothetical protein BpHYR1_047486 [Brachionus plicatilis]